MEAAAAEGEVAVSGVTLSARGAMLVERNGGVSRVAGVVVPPGRVIDTTGAGDSWCGALAAALAMAQAMIDAVSIARAAELACCVASRSVQSRGTQASYFGRADDADVAAMLESWMRSALDARKSSIHTGME